VPLDDFRVPKTPETRTPYVLALLVILGAANAALRGFIGFRYSVEVFVLLAVAAVAYADWRFARPPASLGP
jgi:hypothetical protein